jgi:anaphase-promoting complex subunit 4
MQDIIRCIRLVGHHMLLFASEEQRRFATFSRWLRHQIDVQASDPTSAAGQELLERDAGVDFTLVFSYIENTLEKSKLEAFLCHPMDAPDIDANPEMYDALRKALKGFTTNKSFKADLLKLPAYHKEWCKHNQMLVGQITTWQRANALVPGALMLDNAEIEFCDLRMVADNDTVAHSLSTFVATVGKTNNSQLSLFRVRHSDIFDDVPKSVKSCEAITIGIPEGRIQNLHFLDDCHILVLVEFKKSARLLSIPISPATGASSGLKFAPVSCTAAEMKWPNGRVADIKSHLNLSSDAIETFTKHKFSLDGSFLPKHFEVNGRKDRRLCVMIGQDLRQFGVFDLDSSENGGRRNSIGAGTEVMTES